MFLIYVVFVSDMYQICIIDKCQICITDVFQIYMWDTYLIHFGDMCQICMSDTYQICIRDISFRFRDSYVTPMASPNSVISDLYLVRISDIFLICIWSESDISEVPSRGLEPGTLDLKSSALAIAPRRPHVRNASICAPVGRRVPVSEIYPKYIWYISEIFLVSYNFRYISETFLIYIRNYHPPGPPARARGPSTIARLCVVHKLCVVHICMCFVHSCALCPVVRCAQLCFVRTCALCIVVHCAHLCVRHIN